MERISWMARRINSLRVILYVRVSVTMFDLHRVFKHWKVEMDGHSGIREKED